MNRRISMKNIKEILRLVNENNLSTRQIAKSCGCSPSTVTAIIERYEGTELPWQAFKALDEAEMEAKLYPQEINSSKKELPDWDYIHKELKKKGVTLQLLWQEYKEAYPNGVMYSQFCDHYLKWRKLRNISMHQIHKAGEKIFVDWSGETMYVTDRNTGERKPAYIFIGVLGASDMIYAEAFSTEKLDSWISAHVNMFNYFQGVSQIIVPDNLRTGVKKPCFYEPEIHPTYLEMANHYGTAIIPARVRKPKDKPLAENGVLIAERWIIAKFRNQTFFSFYELNRTIRTTIEDINNKPFQKMEGSRRLLYENIDKPALLPLPVEPYELAIWKHARVNIDYHVEYEGKLYSVPYQLIGQEVDLRITEKAIEIIHKGKRVAVHSRLHGKNREYSTVSEHMPEKHKKAAEWTPERMIKWAGTVGPNTAELVTKIMEIHKHPEVAFRACMGIIRLSDKYTATRVENASCRALKNRSISYKSVESILKSGLDLLPQEEPKEMPPVTHHNIRGIKYYSQEVR
jgi:transposase